jgi:hypothetical protein
MSARSVKDTRVYKLAFELAMEIFEVSKKFPKEETYSYRPDKEIFPECLHLPARGMEEKNVSCPFCIKSD